MKHILLSDSVQRLTFISCIVCARLPDTSAVSATAFKVSSFKGRSLRGMNDFKNLNKMSTSHVVVYLGLGGLRLKIPLKNLRMSLSLFHCLEPFTLTIVNRADFAVLILL